MEYLTDTEIDDIQKDFIQNQYFQRIKLPTHASYLFERCDLKDFKSSLEVMIKKYNIIYFDWHKCGLYHREERYQYGQSTITEQYNIIYYIDIFGNIYQQTHQDNLLNMEPGCSWSLTYNIKIPTLHYILNTCFGKPISGTYYNIDYTVIDNTAKKPLPKYIIKNLNRYIINNFNQKDLYAPHITLDHKFIADYIDKEYTYNLTLNKYKTMVQDKDNAIDALKAQLEIINMGTEDEYSRTNINITYKLYLF